MAGNHAFIIARKAGKRGCSLTSSAIFLWRGLWCTIGCERSTIPGLRYASGPGAERLAVLNEYGLDVRVIGPQVGQASGLKMCYASLTKGLTALATQALVAGEALGLASILTDELRDSQDALLEWVERQVPRMPPKAYRWIGEMEEIARTFADVGLPPQMPQGAAALYRLVGQTELGTETPEERHLGQTLEEVINTLSDALMKDAGPS
jgi:hypothetical protein